ncbi:HD-GYP domain-containing protein [Cytobacillus sp. FJAT-54145]|uniref:HD-GYP domain-containing protein n=1 Tax=Cytobacillus spartinae TaxID=3299023 RepID=A0ABW6KBD4_9BACI
MRLISIDEYNPKLMQLAKPVFDKHRRVLLAAGRTIHPIYLKKLMDLDIRYLFVEDAISFGISMEEMVEVPTWIDATEIVQNAFKTVAQNKEIPIRDLQKLVIRLVNEVSKRKAIVLIPTSSLEEDLREYAHAVNVTLLSLQIAKKLNISQIQLKDLALGTLLHDIGKVLTKNEEDHMFAGFEYLRKVREVSLLSAHVAFQHHEAVDGKGKPRGMREGEIHEFAQLCAITNLYENTLSKEGLPPHEVLEFIMTKSGTVFSPDLVKLFVQEVPYYIPGTRVLMNNGRKAIITKIIGNLHRPYIRYLDTGEEISLASNYTLLITEVVND